MPLKINNLGGVYECDDDGFRTFMIAPIDGKIVLYGTDIQPQTFIYKGPFTKEALRLAFPDKRAAARAATQHTRGVLNKQKFIESANKLSDADKISAIKLDSLLTFIRTCNCAPVKVMEKLIMMGFSDIVGELDFYEESPAMTETTQALIEFIEAMEG